MDLKELEYIIAIAEEGSISKAAERLYLAQSSLSQFLSRYEAELGTKLFTRTSSGMKPTSAGEPFIAHAREILMQYRRMKLELKEHDSTDKGHIEFGISTFRGSNLIPHIIKRFRNEYPDIELILHEHDSLVLQRKIAAGEMDMALVALRAGQKSPEDIPVMQDEVLLVINKNHPAMQYLHYRENPSERPWISIPDTAEFRYLLSNRFTVLGSVAQAQFNTYGITPVCDNDNLTASMALALGRRGIGLAFTYASCTVNSPDVVYASIGENRCFVDLVLIYPPNGYRGKANRVLEDMIRNYINSHNDDN